MNEAVIVSTARTPIKERLIGVLLTIHMGLL